MRPPILFATVLFGVVLAASAAYAQQPTPGPEKPPAVKTLIGKEIAKLEHHAWIVNMLIKPDGSRVYVYYGDCAYMFDSDGKKLGSGPKSQRYRGIDVDRGVVYWAYSIGGGEGQHLIQLDLQNQKETKLVERDQFISFNARFKKVSDIEFRTPVFRSPNGKAYVLGIRNIENYLVDAQFNKLATLTDCEMNYDITPQIDKIIPVFTPDSKTVWVKKTSNGYKFVPYDTETGKAGDPIASNYKAFAIATSPDGKRLFGVVRESTHDTIWRLDVKTQKYDYPIATYGQDTKSKLTAIAFASNANVVAVAEESKGIRVLDSVTGVEYAAVESPDRVGKLALTSDGKTLFAHVGPYDKKNSTIIRYAIE